MAHKRPRQAVLKKDVDRLARWIHDTHYAAVGLASNFDRLTVLKKEDYRTVARELLTNPPPEVCAAVRRLHRNPEDRES